MPKTSKNQSQSAVTTRPPIVVVMGHIDHGKTKILDWYRKTKVAEEESGGITQHIGAYEVEHHGKRITFIDTPGHEAFSKLRARGARVADIAILVVAAEEGVKPQTKEAIEIINLNKLPLVVAINKMDKPEANPEKVKQELAKENILVESYGGKVPSVEISAKVGKNMDELLEILLLLAELENLITDPAKPAEGVIIEAHTDKKRGISATLLVRDGTLRKENTLVLGRGRVETIKIFEDFRGRPIQEASPSSPVLVAGLSLPPTVGDSFHTFATRGEAEKHLASLPEEEIRKEIKSPLAYVEEGKPIFNIIVKTDVVGSQEALEGMIKSITSDAVDFRIIRSEIGDINESDVKMAQATKLVTIVGFKVNVDPAVRQLAENANTHIILGEVIYDLIDMLKRAASDIIQPEIRRVDLGKVKILKVFHKDGTKQIVGGRVEEGGVKRGFPADILRLKEPVGKGNIVELQQNKHAVEMVEKDLECGMMVDSKTEIREGDVIEVFGEEVIKRTL